MLKILGYTLKYLSNVSALPGLWVGRKIRSVLWYYLLASLISDLAGYWLKQVHVNHSFVSNAFLLVEFITVTSYFNTVLFGKKRLYFFIGCLSIGSLIYCYFSYVQLLHTQNEAQAFNYVGASPFYLSYIILSIAGLYKVMSEIEDVKIEDSSLFLSSVAFLLYASGALFPFIYKELAIQNSLSQFNKIWNYFFLPLNTIKNILLAYSLHRAYIAGNR